MAGTYRADHMGSLLRPGEVKQARLAFHEGRLSRGQSTEVEDNVGALGWSISEADMAEIDAIFAQHGVETMPDYWIEND